MDTLAFDAADYLDTEDARLAYLADARLDGPEAVARGEAVVARARTIHAANVSASQRRMA